MVPWLPTLRSKGQLPLALVKYHHLTVSRGLIAAYYFGCLFGAFFGGSMADKYGRKKGVWLGSMFCIVGGSLQAGSQNTDMFICARVIAGIGIGFMNSIVPPWISELAKAHNRGANFAMIFIANCELAPTDSGLLR